MGLFNRSKNYHSILFTLGQYCKMTSKMIDLLHALGGTSEDAGHELTVVHLLEGKLHHGGHSHDGNEQEENLHGVDHCFKWEVISIDLE